MESITLEEFIQQAQDLIKKHPKLAKSIVLLEGGSYEQEMFYVSRIVKLKDKTSLKSIRQWRGGQTLGVVIEGDTIVY